MVTLLAELMVIKEGIAVLEQELRITTQRVNLFEKVKIPECQENIRQICIYLGDQQATAVGVSKVAKKKIEVRDLELAVRMIVPMKKLHVIVQKKDIVPALESLRELGSVHVEHQEELSGYQLEERREEVVMLTQALDILQRFECKVNVPQQEARDWTDTVNEILELWAQIEHYQGNITQREIQIHQWEPWGDFDPKDIEALVARGIDVQLCEVPAGKETVAPKGVVLEKIHLASGTYKCLAICREKVELPWETITPPALGLGQMKKMQTEDQVKILQAEGRITELRCYCGAFQEILVERENVLRFEEVEKGMRGGGTRFVKRVLPHRRLRGYRGAGETGTMGNFV